MHNCIFQGTLEFVNGKPLVPNQYDVFGHGGMVFWMTTSAFFFLVSYHIKRRERSGSVVECLTRDRGAVGSSLTGVTALCR